LPAPRPSPSGPRWQRLLGNDAVAPSAAPEATATEPGLDQRLKLVGVASPRGPAQQAREGVALIAVDGEAPRAFRVGQAVQGRHVLQRVAASAVDIGPPGLPAAARLELPPLPPAATGTLPAASSGRTGAPQAPPPAAAMPAPPPTAAMPAPPPGVARRLDLPPQRGESPPLPSARQMQ
jgi:general secretion pathway protein C